MWPVGVGVVVGSVVGFTLLQDARAQAALTAAAEGVRLPEPGFAMQVPTTAQEFEILQAIVCECMQDKPPQEGRPIDDIADELTLCAAKRLYRNFPWPPVPGDHPTTATLWGTIDVMVRRSLALADCEKKLP